VDQVIAAIGQNTNLAVWLRAAGIFGVITIAGMIAFIRMRRNLEKERENPDTWIGSRPDDGRGDVPIPGEDGSGRGTSPDDPEYPYLHFPKVQQLR